MITYTNLSSLLKSFHERDLYENQLQQLPRRVFDNIRELKQRRRRRRGQRQVKNEFKFYKRNSRWSSSVRYDNGSENVPRLNMQRRRSLPNGNTKN